MAQGKVFNGMIMSKTSKEGKLTSSQDNTTTTYIKRESPVVANGADELHIEPAATSSQGKPATESVGGGSVSTKQKRALSRANSSYGGTIGGQQQQQQGAHPNFGASTLVSTEGNFPALGSILGPYFCVGRLGKGTFCSIHRCINLHHFHQNPPQQTVSASSATVPVKQEQQEEEQQHSSCRIAAAKVEIGEFRNSGVLGGEATMLQFLDASLPMETVPLYMGHYRGSENVSAILMEYLPGQDMHQIRDWATKQKTRRIAVEDAVYLTADVMLPLLQRMHQVGIVHRDVKPSNCVKRKGLKDFAMVDFGLSKSIVIHKNSADSDPDHPWMGTDWMRPPNYTGEGHYRRERQSADFRGTSMYASVRVHQSKDYSPRDDMWSLMYVFCDLVSGGLPWMSYAANRDREACRSLKERIHGEVEGIPDQTEQLLMGHEYHLAMFKENKVLDPPLSSHIKVEDPSGSNPSSLPTPLAMSNDEKKVQLLRTAFDHLRKLSFFDMPDYELLKSSILGFLDGPAENQTVAAIEWERLATENKKKRSKGPPPLMGLEVPTWDLLDHMDDAVDTDLFLAAEDEAKAAGEIDESLVGEAANWARLPLEFRFRLAQMEYNAKHSDSIAPHLALRDWFKVVLPILYGEWDSKKFEKGGHRTNTDGYRRELYLRIVEKCLKWSGKFHNFHSLACIYEENNSGEPERKKRRIISTVPQSSAPASSSSPSFGSELISISKVSFQLRSAKRVEEKKPYAPPPRLSFGTANGR